MRERGGTWIAHGAGTADRDTGRRRRQGARAARTVRRTPAPAVDSSRRVRRLLRRIRQRGTVAALPSGRRAAEVPDAKTGTAYKHVNAALPRPSTREMPTRRHAGVSPGLSPRDDGVVSARLRPDVRDRDVLAHPLAESRSPADVPMAARAARRAARQRSARVPGRARSPQLHPGGRRTSSAPRSKPTARACDSEDARTTVVSVPIGVDYDRIQGVVADAAFDAEQLRLARDVRAVRADIDRSRRRSARLHQGDSRTARGDRSRVCAPARAARPLHVRADRRAVAIRARSYGAIEPEIDRKVAEVNAKHGVPGMPPPIYYHKSALTLAEPRRALPHGPLLRRQLARTTA